MKKGLEELKSLDYEFVASKAHIVQTTLDDIINKRFEKLNPVKAKGLIKILEREFDLDLSEWIKEFEAYHSLKEPEIQTLDKLHAKSIQNDKKRMSKIALSLLTIAILAGTGYIIYLQQNSVSPKANTTETLQNEINETNASISFNIAFDENRSEQNGSVESNATEVNKTATMESNTTQIAPSTASAPSATQGSFFVEPEKKVWIGIRYLDTNKSRWFETVTDKRFDFNASREQLVTFGHSQVKIVAGSTTIESKAGAKERFHYKDGKLMAISEEEYNKLSGKTEADTTKPKH